MAPRRRWFAGSMAAMLKAGSWRAPSSGSTEVAQTALSFGGSVEMDAPAGVYGV